MTTTRTDDRRIGLLLVGGGLAVLVVVVGALGPWAPWSPWSDASSTATDSGSPLVVPLGTPTSDLVGLDWPVDGDGRPRLGTAVEEPREVEVRVGDRVVLTTPSRNVVLTQRDGVVATVALLPQEAAADIATSVDDVRDLLDDHGLLGDGVAAELDAIVTDPPDPDPLLGDTPSLRTTTDDADVFVEFRPTDDGAWFAAIEVAAPIG